MAKEEAFEIQIENLVKISDDLHLADAMYLVALKFIDPINALTHEKEARGITEQYKQDFILQSRMFQANVINHLRKKANQTTLCQTHSHQRGPKTNR